MAIMVMFLVIVISMGWATPSTGRRATELGKAVWVPPSHHGVGGSGQPFGDYGAIAAALLTDVEVGSPAVPLSCLINTGTDFITFIDPATIYNPLLSSRTLSKYTCCPAGVYGGVGGACGGPSNKGGCVVKLRIKRTTSTGWIDSFFNPALATESFRFRSGLRPVSNQLLPFLLADDHFGDPANGDNKATCWVGLGRGKMSLISRLNGSQFSYFFTERSRLILGPSPPSFFGGENKTAVITPLVKRPPDFPYSSAYYISLKGISVGETLLDVAEEVFQLNSDGSGGMIMDSSASFSYLPRTAFDALYDEVEKQLGVTGVFEQRDAGVRCFALPSPSTFPDLTVTFHLDGGNGDLRLPAKNCFYRPDDSPELTCLGMGDASDAPIMEGLDRVAGKLGNFQQQDMAVTFDLVKDTVSFVSI